MRILHINTYQTGGAALCMQRIGKALQQQGVECRYLLMQGTDNEYTSIATGDTDLWSKYVIVRAFQKIIYILGFKPKFIRLRHKLEHAQANNEDRIFTTLPISSYQSLPSHQWIQEADIIHLHWIGNFVDFPTFFKSIKKPIVWRLPDFNAILGCFHYLNCDKQTSKQLLAIEKECASIKRKSLSNTHDLHIVAISEQMREAISRSQILGKYHITLINNGVDTNKYHHYDKESTRKEFGFKQDDIIFMFSSQSLEDKRKGLKELMTALETLNIENSLLLCIGSYQKQPNTNIRIKCVGPICDETTMAKFYSVSDYFVTPAFQESFGQTTTEALSCGTPVIAFPSGIAADIIDDELGVICKDFSVAALIESITQALKRKYDHTKIRQRIIDHFSYEIIANQYKNLYKSILDSHHIKVSNGKFSELDQDKINQQKEEHEKQIDLFHQLDAKRDFYKMVTTHPRYIAGWFKKKIKNLFN